MICLARGSAAALSCPPRPPEPTCPPELMIHTTPPARSRVFSAFVPSPTLTHNGESFNPTQDSPPPLDLLKQARPTRIYSLTRPPLSAPLPTQGAVCGKPEHFAGQGQTLSGSANNKPTTTAPKGTAQPTAPAKPGNGAGGRTLGGGTAAPTGVADPERREALAKAAEARNASVSGSNW